MAIKVYNGTTWDDIVGSASIGGGTSSPEYIKLAGSDASERDSTFYGGGHTIVVNDLSTEGNMGDGKEELTALAQQACDSYEENL